MQEEKPRKEHEWLQKLVGEWTYETEMSPGPGQPVEKISGTDSVRTLGGFWAVCESRGKMPGGGDALSIMTIGFDALKQSYVGSFVGSMMSSHWVYESGELDAGGKVLTLHTEGPSFAAEGKTARYRDVITFNSDDERTLTSNVLGEDGKWTQFMSMTYRRKK